MRYLITGHTGFKGSWLTLLLTAAGHEVSGLALDPEPGTLFERAKVHQRLSQDRRGDIREKSVVRDAVVDVRPAVVLHLAAQPLVRRSYDHPDETLQVNVNGTMNVLDAIRYSDSVQASLIVTTDKVYKNDGRHVGYREVDALGGRDPYSASKAMADILTESWVVSFDLPPTVIARAGNVIGGGDSAQDRLVPDLVRAWSQNRLAAIRNGEAIRPWQHVLDCLNGYMLAVDASLTAKLSTSLNFGPLPEQVHTVRDLVRVAAQRWGTAARWEDSPTAGPHEESILLLDSSKARKLLAWNDLLSFEEAVNWTVEWEQGVLAGQHPMAEMERQIEKFARMS